LRNIASSICGTVREQRCEVFGHRVRLRWLDEREEAQLEQLVSRCTEQRFGGAGVEDNSPRMASTSARPTIVGVID
jgi:hypothetical protein